LFGGEGGVPALGEAVVDREGDGGGGFGLGKGFSDGFEGFEDPGGDGGSADPAEGGAVAFEAALGGAVDDPAAGGVEEVSGGGGDRVEHPGGFGVVEEEGLALGGHEDGLSGVDPGGEEVGAAPAGADVEAGFGEADGVRLESGSGDEAVAVHREFEAATEDRAVDGGNGREGEGREKSEDARRVREVAVQVGVGNVLDGLEVGAGDEDAFACGSQDEAAGIPGDLLKRELEAADEGFVKNDDGFARLFEGDGHDTGEGARGFSGEGKRGEGRGLVGVDRHDWNSLRRIQEPFPSSISGGKVVGPAVHSGLVRALTEHGSPCVFARRFAGVLLYGIPNFTDREHDFNAWMRRLAPVLTVVLLGLVILMQQFLRSITDPTLAEPPEEVRISEEVNEPGIEGLVLNAKIAVKIKAARLETDIRWTEMVGQLDTMAATRTDRLRTAVVAGELLGKEAALERLKRLKAEVTSGSDLASDADWLTRLYTKGRDALPEDAVKSLVDGEYHRATSTSGFADIAAYSLTSLLTSLAMFMAAIAALVSIAKRWNNRDFDSQFTQSALPPGIYLETFGVEQLLFLFLLIMQVMTLWLTGTASVVALAFNEILLWLTPLCFLWPAMRGVKWILVADDLGLHMGEGFATEARMGVVAYLATIPVYFALNVIFGIVEASMGLEEATDEIPGFPSFQPPLSGSWIPVILGALGAVVFAPIVEEILFRGALYRYLRSKRGVVVSVIVSSLAFGFIHPYDLTGLIQVSVMGACLALMREWRGSLIAPIVAHMLHNGHLTLFEIWGIAAAS